MPVISWVFSQRLWPGHDPKPDDGSPDLDDCWVISGLQGVNACAPWLRLPTVTEFRAAAGDPDDGVSDGGNPEEIAAGVRKLWPELGQLLEVVKGGARATVAARLEARRPISLCVDSSKLPVRLRFAFTGSHQVTLIKANVSGAPLFANPLVTSAYTRPQTLTAAELSAVIDAAMAYGVLRGGRQGIWAVVFPTDEDALRTWRVYRAAAAEDAAELDADAVAAARLEGFTAARTKAGEAVAAIVP